MSKTINNIWAELSTNRLDFTEEEVGVGILYKAPVISNQLNGVMFNVYQMIDYLQKTGGFYNKQKTYYFNNIVSILYKDLSGNPYIQLYRCIDTNNDGIINDPPIVNANYDDSSDIPIFYNGDVNITKWVRCDVQGANILNYTRETFDFNKLIKLFTINIPSNITTTFQEIKGNYNIVVYYNNYVTICNIDIKGYFIKMLNGTVVILPNRLGINAPEININNVYTNIIDYGNEQNFNNLMPYGFCFQYENVSNGANDIFLKLNDGVTKLEISGEGNYINVLINNNVDFLNDYINIPVRAGGGFLEFNQIGNIIDKDFNLPVEMQYKMGLLKLNSKTTYNGDNIKQSPLWGDTTNTSALFSYLAKVRGNYNISQWQGVFRRNCDEHLIPGYSEITPIRNIASLQNDAIRNITAKISQVSTTLTNSNYTPSGAFKITKWNKYAANLATSYAVDLEFDSSQIVPTSYDNRPINVATQFYIKAF